MTDPLAAIAAMRADYQRGLPALAAAVASDVARARDDAAARREATRAAHRIRGTAGSLGLGAIGEAAGRVEDALEIEAWDQAAQAAAELIALIAG